MNKVIQFSIVSALIAVSSLAVANAQMSGYEMPDVSKMPGVPKMPSMPKMDITGNYNNAKWGLQFVIPKGYSGMEMAFGDSLSVMITKGTSQDMGSDMNSIVMVTATKPKKVTATGEIPEEYKNKCKAPQISSADINGNKFSVITAECTIEGKTGTSKIYTTTVGGTLYSAVGMSMSGNASTTVDDIAKTIKIGKSETGAAKKEVKKDTKTKKSSQPSSKASPKATDKTKPVPGKKLPQPSPMASPKATAKKTNTMTGTAISQEVTVEMAKDSATNQKCDDKCYVPNVITIPVGGKVTWKNLDSAAHTASSTDGKTFDTSLVNAGATASATIKTAGSYDYICIVHPWMKGKVIVK